MWLIRSGSWLRIASRLGRIPPPAVPALLVAAFSICSCTLVAHSPHIRQAAEIEVLKDHRGLAASFNGQIPYQRWRLPSWGDELRHVWLVGHHDFRKSDRLEIILYFHGMHSKDYYRAFQAELKEVAEKHPRRPFLFVGLVDTPFVDAKTKSEQRWKGLVPKDGERPDRLFDVVNQLYKAIRITIPHVKKENTRLVLAGFSGGGRVLDSVGKWLAVSPKDDPYAAVFRSTLSKLVYFDCWFDPTIVETVPTLLEANPRIKIVGTVHMKKPEEHARKLAGKLNLVNRKGSNEMVGHGGRVVIFKDKSHWDAVISRLSQALGV
ncbi:MAG: hypothetical protein FJ118_15560 [Deltaproteobacteria bacterium]|nr:hypothetical protein [Deltaproteobacteria bacterium]